MGIVIAKNLNLYYGNVHALKNVNIDIERNSVAALIGPSGCGKSTFLRTVNRMNDLIDYVKIGRSNIWREKYIQLRLWCDRLKEKSRNGIPKT